MTSFISNILRLAVVVSFACLYPSYIHADIYFWEGEDGVMKFSNYLSPAGAKVYIEEIERTPDEMANPPAEDDLEAPLQEAGDVEQLPETDQNIEPADQQAERLVEDLERRVDELEESLHDANQRLEEAESYGEGFADGLLAGAESSNLNDTTLYVGAPGYILSGFAGRYPYPAYFPHRAYFEKHRFGRRDPKLHSWHSNGRYANRFLFKSPLDQFRLKRQTMMKRLNIQPRRSYNASFR